MLLYLVCSMIMMPTSSVWTNAYTVSRWSTTLSCAWKCSPWHPRSEYYHVRCADWQWEVRIFATITRIHHWITRSLFEACCEFEFFIKRSAGALKCCLRCINRIHTAGVRFFWSNFFITGDWCIPGSGLIVRRQWSFIFKRRLTTYEPLMRALICCSQQYLAVFLSCGVQCPGSLTLQRGDNSSSPPKLHNLDRKEVYEIIALF